jgi:hypothetical protein
LRSILRLLLLLLVLLLLGALLILLLLLLLLLGWWWWLHRAPSRQVLLNKPLIMFGAGMFCITTEQIAIGV